MKKITEEFKQTDLLSPVSPVYLNLFQNCWLNIEISEQEHKNVSLFLLEPNVHPKWRFALTEDILT